MDIIKIFGVKINNITFEEAKEEVKGYLKGDKLNVIYTPNPEIVMGAKDDSKLRELINRGDLVIADGIGLIYASRIKKKPIKERVRGYDLSIELLNIANANNYSLYLLGAKDGVAKAASERIQNLYPNIKVSGYHHGFFKGSHIGHENHEEESEIIKDINSANPDIIFVGLGFPRAELWIDSNRDKLNGKLIIANGGVIDVLSGNLKMTPEIIRKLGLEWLHRLIREPSRIKRQLVIPKFMIKVIFSKDVVK